MQLSRIDRLYVGLEVTAALPDGTPTTVAGVDVALLAPRASPAEGTVWTAADYASGTATVLLAGPDADSAGAFAVPSGGADLWIRVLDDPEVITARVERISVT